MVNGPQVEWTVKRSAKEKAVLEGSVVEDAVNIELEVDKLLFKWLGIESLW